jgi:regulator of sirC expression with transglutaminase-like and TPR domain
MTVTTPLFIHPAEARRRFQEFSAGKITNGNLVEGALLIALEDYPQLDMEAPLAQLNDLATRVERRSSAGDPPVFKVGQLHAEMFDVDGYDGDRTSYNDPRNAYLNEVVSRRKGLPISLSIIFLHVAERIGLQASGVGLPGHFIVKVQFELNELFVDPFNAGGTLTLPEVAGLLETMTDGEVRLSSQHLRAWSGREILMRVLANLMNMHSRAGDQKKAAAARERIAILQKKGEDERVKGEG